MANPLCARCDHPLSAHCKGNEAHTAHKEDQRMLAVEYRKLTLVCKTRHCKNPLCSCVDFIEKKEE